MPSLWIGVDRIVVSGTDHDMETADGLRPSDRKAPIPVLYKISKAAFVGLLIGFLAALWLSQWVWLEMRVNVGALIPGSILVCALLAVWTGKEQPGVLMLLLEVILAVSFVVIYGWRWETLVFMPACLFREGCHAGLLRIDAVNFLLGVVLLCGNGVWLLARCGGRTCGNP